MSLRILHLPISYKFIHRILGFFNMLDLGGETSRINILKGFQMDNKKERI